LAVYDYARLVSDLLVVGVFMVVIGIAFSLGTQTATRAMTLTILGWLASMLVLAALAGILMLMAMLVVFIGWLIWIRMQADLMAALSAGPPMNAWPGFVYQGARVALYLLAALLIAGWCRSHFDRLAGRAVASDTLPAKRGPRVHPKWTGS
jgi:hypothetical protein